MDKFEFKIGQHKTETSMHLPNKNTPSKNLKNSDQINFDVFKMLAELKP